MAHELRSARLSNGLTLQYATQGDPAGTPVVFLHGVTDSWRSFEPVLPHLPDSVRAFAVTQRGHGDSDRPMAGYRARDFAADVGAFLDAVGVETAVVVGQSMGGTNAIRFALDRPARTRGLVLVASFASFRRSAAAVEFNDTAVRNLTDPIDVHLAREFQLGTLARPIPRSFFDAVVAETMKVPARVWRASFDAMLDDECTDELSAVRVPTLVLSGGQDAFSDSANQRALVAAIPGTHRIEYEAAGHALHWEAPADFAADLLAFVESLKEEPSPALQP